MNEQEAREKAMKRVAMGADSDLTDEQRPHCYKAWSEYQDISEQDVDNRCPDIGDFRVGFIAGWNAQLTTATDRITELEKALREIRDSFLTRSPSIPIHMIQIMGIAEKALNKEALLPGETK